jgi:hypothetical protein
MIKNCSLINNYRLYLNDNKLKSFVLLMLFTFMGNGVENNIYCADAASSSVPVDLNLNKDLLAQLTESIEKLKLNQDNEIINNIKEYILSINKNESLTYGTKNDFLQQAIGLMDFVVDQSEQLKENNIIQSLYSFFYWSTVINNLNSLSQDEKNFFITTFTAAIQQILVEKTPSNLLKILEAKRGYGNIFYYTFFKLQKDIEFRKIAMDEWNKCFLLTDEKLIANNIFELIRLLYVNVNNNKELKNNITDILRSYFDCLLTIQTPEEKQNFEKVMTRLIKLSYQEMENIKLNPNPNPQIYYLQSFFSEDLKNLLLNEQIKNAIIKLINAVAIETDENVLLQNTKSLKDFFFQLKRINTSEAFTEDMFKLINKIASSENKHIIQFLQSKGINEIFFTMGNFSWGEEIQWLKNEVIQLILEVTDKYENEELIENLTSIQRFVTSTKYILLSNTQDQEKNQLLIQKVVLESIEKIKKTSDKSSLVSQLEYISDKIDFYNNVFLSFVGLRKNVIAFFQLDEEAEIALTKEENFGILVAAKNCYKNFMKKNTNSDQIRIDLTWVINNFFDCLDLISETEEKKLFNESIIDLMQLISEEDSRESINQRTKSLTSFLWLFFGLLEEKILKAEQKKAILLMIKKMSNNKESLKQLSLECFLLEYLMGLIENKTVSNEEDIKNYIQNYIDYINSDDKQNLKNNLFGNILTDIDEICHSPYSSLLKYDFFLKKNLIVEILISMDMKDKDKSLQNKLQKDFLTSLNKLILAMDKEGINELSSFLYFFEKLIKEEKTQLIQPIIQLMEKISEKTTPILKQIQNHTFLLKEYLISVEDPLKNINSYINDILEENITSYIEFITSTGEEVLNKNRFTGVWHFIDSIFESIEKIAQITAGNPSSSPMFRDSYLRQILIDFIVSVLSYIKKFDDKEEFFKSSADLIKAMIDKAQGQKDNGIFLENNEECIVNDKNNLIENIQWITYNFKNISRNFYEMFSQNDEKLENFFELLTLNIQLITKLITQQDIEKEITEDSDMYLCVFNAYGCLLGKYKDDEELYQKNYQQYKEFMEYQLKLLDDPTPIDLQENIFMDKYNVNQPLLQSIYYGLIPKEIRNMNSKTTSQIISLCPFLLESNENVYVLSNSLRGLIKKIRTFEAFDRLGLILKNIFFPEDFQTTLPLPRHSFGAPSFTGASFNGPFFCAKEINYENFITSLIELIDKIHIDRSGDDIENNLTIVNDIISNCRSQNTSEKKTTEEIIKISIEQINSAHNNGQNQRKTPKDQERIKESQNNQDESDDQSDDQSKEPSSNDDEKDHQPPKYNGQGQQSKDQNDDDVNGTVVVLTIVGGVVVGIVVPLAIDKQQKNNEKKQLDPSKKEDQSQQDQSELNQSQPTQSQPEELPEESEEKKQELIPNKNIDGQRIEYSELVEGAN